MVTTIALPSKPTKKQIAPDQLGGKAKYSWIGNPTNPANIAPDSKVINCFLFLVC